MFGWLHSTVLSLEFLHSATMSSFSLSSPFLTLPFSLVFICSSIIVCLVCIICSSIGVIFTTAIAPSSNIRFPWSIATIAGVFRLLALLYRIGSDSGPGDRSPTFMESVPKSMPITIAACARVSASTKRRRGRRCIYGWWGVGRWEGVEERRGKRKEGRVWKRTEKLTAGRSGSEKWWWRGGPDLTWPQWDSKKSEIVQFPDREKKKKPKNQNKWERKKFSHTFHTIQIQKYGNERMHEMFKDVS